MRRRVLPIAALLLLTLVSQGCAWANRDNRPVWNAFEENLVPDDEVLLWVTAPLTIPGGLLAIVLDVFLVHPAQVLDDAWGDTTELWDDIDWREDYYSQTAYSLIRVPGSAIMLVGSFFARSMFDIEPNDGRHSPHPPRGRPAALPLDEPPARVPGIDLVRTRRLLDWFAQLLVDSQHAEAPDATPTLPSVWTDALATAAARVLESDDAVARLRVRRFLLLAGPDTGVDPVQTFADPDPRVRLALALDMPRLGSLHWGDAMYVLRKRMLDDDDPLVRRAARERQLDDPDA